MIVFRGRAGDRNDLAMAGSTRLGAAIHRVLRDELNVIGSPAPPLAAGFATELDAARESLAALQDAFRDSLRRGVPSYVTMGRCAAALATLPVIGVVRPDAALVWFDAHGDCNTPTSSSTHYLGGMVLSGAAGLWTTGLGAGLDLSNVVLVGARDLDPFERELIAGRGIRAIAASADLPDRLREALAGRSTYVHLDCDVLNPGIVPSDYQIPDGLSLSDLQAAFSVIAEQEVIGVEIAEFQNTWSDGELGDTVGLLSAISPLTNSGVRRIRGKKTIRVRKPGHSEPS